MSRHRKPGCEPVPLTPAVLRARHPALWSAVARQAVSEAGADATALRASVVVQERARIRQILDLSMPPVEPFVRRLAFETTVSPERAAVLIVRALRAIGRHADPTATAFVLSVTQPNSALKLDFEP